MTQKPENPQKLKWKKGDFNIDTDSGHITKNGHVCECFGIDVRYGDIILTHLPTGLACGAFPTIGKAKKFAEWFAGEFDVANASFDSMKNAADEQRQSLILNAKKFGRYSSPFLAGAAKTEEMLAQRKKENT